MARYTGPTCRLCRRYGDKLMLKGERCFSPKCAFEKRPTPPGDRTPRRRRVSDRALQLREKQKARYAYGIMERQFGRYYRQAVRRSGVTGENLLRLLEMRLDNVIYRLGFADSRFQARQVVRHGHILLNGRKTNVPSCQVKAGDVIGWRAASKNKEPFKIAQEMAKSARVPGWLNLDTEAMVGRVLSPPGAGDTEAKFDASVIVEFYSR
jgi:small subunit ribosomal protein S4